MGAIEGLFAKHGTLDSLSAQNLVDCSTSFNQGCDGGNFMLAFGYVAEFGILKEENYPYNGKQGNCRKQGGQKIDDMVLIPESEDAILSALCKYIVHWLF